MCIQLPVCTCWHNVGTDGTFPSLVCISVFYQHSRQISILLLTYLAGVIIFVQRCKMLSEESMEVVTNGACP